MNQTSHNFNATINEHEVQFSVDLPSEFSNFQTAEYLYRLVDETEKLENNLRDGNAPQRNIMR